MNQKEIYDLSGQKIDFLEILRKEPCGKTGHQRYLCKCECGKEFVKRKDAILKMRIKSCGCKAVKAGQKRKPIKPIDNITSITKLKDHRDLSGQKFGRLLVVKYIGSDKNNKRLYECLCDCGNTKITTQALLKRGEVTSCGCRHKEIINTQGGLSKKRIYAVYQSMKIRCYNKSFKQYNDYGGRGITVCDEWLGKNGLVNFIEWAYANGYDENAPRGQCTLDRINNNGNYEPSNCRWVTMLEQAKNKRNLSKRN